MNESNWFDAEQAKLGASLLREQHRREIERAIRRVKWPMTAMDRWFRREWYKADAVGKWPEWPQRSYAAWRRQ